MKKITYNYRSKRNSHYVSYLMFGLKSLLVFIALIFYPSCFQKFISAFSHYFLCHASVLLLENKLEAICYMLNEMKELLYYCVSYIL